MININIGKTRAFLAKRFLPERQMTAPSGPRPQTWRPTWRATCIPANPSTIKSIIFRSAQSATYACAQVKTKMDSARRRDHALREHPATWKHTLMGDHISAADLSLDQADLKLDITLLDAGTLFGDLIAVSNKNVNDAIIAFREFYGEDPFYYFHSDNAKELKAAAEQKLMVHFTSTPHRPESNGVVERFNQFIVDGARYLLLATLDRAARSILALRVQGLLPGAQRLREGQERSDSLGHALRQEVSRQAPPVRLAGDLPAAEARSREVRAEGL